MKELFLTLRELLKAVPDLQFIDKDKGQIDRYETRPPVAFPCCLIKISNTPIEYLHSTLQRRTAIITLRLAFNYVGSTNADTPENLLIQSLEYFDTVEKVEQAILPNYYKNHRFTQTASIEENRPDGLTVINLQFRVQYEKNI